MPTAAQLSPVTPPVRSRPQHALGSTFVDSNYKAGWAAAEREQAGGHTH